MHFRDTFQCHSSQLTVYDVSRKSEAQAVTTAVGGVQYSVSVRVGASVRIPALERERETMVHGSFSRSFVLQSQLQSRSCYSDCDSRACLCESD